MLSSSSSLTIQHPCTTSPKNPSIPQTPILKIQSSSPLNPNLKKPIKKISAFAASLTQDSSIDTNEPKRKLDVVVKPMERPRLVLKFVWMEKNLGIAIDQVIPGGFGTVPVSPYYFWPRKDAWEELKVMLESKPWVSQKQMVILLNHATDIINLWQESGGDLAS